MKKKLLFLFAVLIFFGTSTKIMSQGWDDYYKIKNALIENGFTVSKDVYQDLKEGETFKLEKDFYSGNDYVLVAFSIDGDVKDVDLYVYELDGDLYIKDATDANYALVEMSPQYSRNMTIKVKNYKSQTPSYLSKCLLLVAYKKHV
jgi:hypothetical protein